MKSLVAQRCFSFFVSFPDFVLERRIASGAGEVFGEAFEAVFNDGLFGLIRNGLLLARGLLGCSLFGCHRASLFLIVLKHFRPLHPRPCWSVLGCRLDIPADADSNGSRIKIPVAFFDGGVICAGRFFRSREISKVNLSFDSVFPHLQLSGVQVAPFV